MEKFREAVKELVDYDFKARDELKRMGPFKASGYSNWWSLIIMITLFVAGFYAMMLTVFYFLSGRFAPKTMSIIVLCVCLAFYVLMYIRKHIINVGLAREERGKRDRLLAGRRKYVEACTTAARECGVSLYPWWEKFNPYQNFMQNYLGNRTWSRVLRKPITRRDGKLFFDGFYNGGEIVSGEVLIEKYIDAFDKSGKHVYKCFFGEKISRNENYVFASLGTFRAHSAAYTQRVWRADKNADEKTRAFERELDWNEAVSNAFWNEDFSTDKEMYLKGYGTTFEYMEKRDKRKKKVSDYKNSLGEYETYVEDEGIYYMNIDFEGYTVFDEGFNRLIGLIIPKSDTSIKVKTNATCPGENCEIVEMKKDAVGAYITKPCDILQHITFYFKDEFDFTISKPGNVTDDEWGLWIYSHYTEDFLFIDENYHWNFWNK